jgi:hypothetical protein
MSNGNGNSTPRLSSCGCCEGIPALDTITNRAGLPALAYRIGTYGLFLQRMLDQIHSVSVPDSSSPEALQPLAGLTTRSLDDPAIALLDAWAILADVLAFYQERIANEGYLRTATERRSVLELARAIGFELSPGVAASAYLQFTVEEIIGIAAGTAASFGARIQPAAGPGSSAYNSGIVSVPLGTQVQSVPAPGQLPQTFETSADFEAQVAWNLLTPRLNRPQDLALSGGALYLLGTTTSFPSDVVVQLPVSQVYLLSPLTQLDPSLTAVPAVAVNQIYLQGTSTNLQNGDRLLLVGTGNNTRQSQAFIVRNVVVDSSAKRTLVAFADNPTLPSFGPGSFPSADLRLQNIPFTQDNVGIYILEHIISEGDLQAFLKINGWDADDLASLVNNPPAAPASANGVFAFEALASFFGYNAPLYNSLPDPSKALRGDPYPNSWDAANNGLGTTIWTDSQGRPYTDATVFLERSFPQVLAESWTLFESPTVASTAYWVTGVIERALADYGLSGKSTGLMLANPPALSPYDDLSGSGKNDPAVASWDHDRLDIFVVGSADGALYHKWWDGSQWGPSVAGFEFLGGIVVGNPAVASWDHDRLDVFAVGTDGALYHKAWNGSQWLPSLTGYDKLGGDVVGSPAVASWDHDRLDVFVVGTDGGLYHKAWDGSQWLPSPTDFDNLGKPDPGGPIRGNPVVVSWDHDRLDIFVVGSTDGALYHKWWDGSAWGPSLAGFELLGGFVVGNPAVASWDHDRLDVFVVGTDGALYHKAWNGSQWVPSQTGYDNLGGSIIGNPAAVSWDHDRLDIFVVGTDHALYHKAWDGSQWLPSPAGFENLGGYASSNPAVASWDHDRLDVFVLGGDAALYHKAWDGTSWGTVPFLVRTTRAFVQSEQLALAAMPVLDDAIAAGTIELALDELVLGLQPGQPVALYGMQSDAPGVAAGEVLVLKDIIHKGGFTSLLFTSGMKYGYLRSSLTVNANVTLATHGATVQEVLGNGDGSQTNQSFVLKRPPLTYVSAPSPSGVASTLTIRVNGLEWQEVPTLYGLDTCEQTYIVRLADGGAPTLTFGDPAARLKTGQQNITATYRTGIGLAGNVDQGSLSMLLSRPPGLRGVTNPLAASGGADPQDLDHARASAPLAVLTLDRIVSLDDYENFARAFAGVGKAQAVPVWSGKTRLVHITVGAANGDTIDSSWPLYQTLVQAIAGANDPVQTFLVAGYQLLLFNLTASILIDRTTYDPTVVLAQVGAALASAFSFEQRAFAQAVTAAEIIALVQSVAGVVAVDLTQLYLTGDPNGPGQTEPPPFLTALPARWQAGAIQPAQLLLLNPLGVTPTEMAS